MSAITAPFSGGNYICHQSNDLANNVTATGGPTEQHFLYVVFPFIFMVIIICLLQINCTHLCARPQKLYRNLKI
jgi:hypothetical protein